MMNRASAKELFLWGGNYDGRLGLGDDAVSTFFMDPTKLSVPDIPWAQVACGLCHTAALSSNGEVFTWGSGNWGRLGHGDQNHRFVPTKVEIPGGERIVKVSCGDYHTAAVTASGKLFTWYVRRGAFVSFLNRITNTLLKGLWLVWETWTWK